MYTKILLILFLITLLLSCNPSSEEIASQTTQVWTPTLNAMATIIPTPTLDPNADPDGDTHPTLFEQIWGTDPLVSTSFEELSTHPGTIYAKMRVSQPFDVDDMNGTPYQVVWVVEIEDNYTSDSPSDDHLIFEVVLFPYARYEFSDISKPVDRFPIPTENYPAEIQQYLESTEYSEFTEEMQSELLEVIKNSTTICDAIRKIVNWNKINFDVMKLDRGLYFSEIVKLNAREMFEKRETWYSTSRATLIAAEMRAIGIPCMIGFRVYITNETNQTMGLYDHPHNFVFIKGQWVRLDFYEGLNNQSNSRDPYSYTYLVFTDLYVDVSIPDWNETIKVTDDWSGTRNHEERWWQLHKPLEFREN